MSLCINPKCAQPDCEENRDRAVCASCNSELILREGYRVVRLLSDATGFGTIYEASDRGEPKILKVLKVHNTKAIELFQQEAQVLSRLDHPGTPKIDDYFTWKPKGSDTELYCLVMEKIQGKNLQQWFKENPPIDEEQAKDWLKQLVNILGCVHQEHYFHRDIKPANIMLRPNGKLVLIDFGTAREMTATYLSKVGDGSGVTSIASAGYTPLEQNNGKAVPQSDFYALGRTFVYLLTGKSPTEFDEDPRSGNLIWRDSAERNFGSLGDLIDELMAPFPGNRPQNTRVIKERLAQIDRENPQDRDAFEENHRGKKFWLAGAVVLLILIFGGGARLLFAPSPSTLTPLSLNSVGKFLERIMRANLNEPTPDVPSPVPSAIAPNAIPDTLPQAPSLTSTDKGVALELSVLEELGGFTRLAVTLTNNSPRTIKFLWSDWVLQNEKEQTLSALQEGLKLELQPNEQTSGTLKIPSNVLTDSQEVSLFVTDLNKTLTLEIPQIPITEPQEPVVNPSPIDESPQPEPIVSPSPLQSPQPTESPI
ncbi:protein kinase [Lusitaniella coriacea LEGE 07157]|uniref:non-specific serine/threonine protein kinase n=1 Tax=Lusitaniella coriacea LEGE 07157 TaxID=945747 RepID=A0A8J7AWK9_9CYAN|nr:serine/threonine-protein kinase [Lusitaniella coriacea]MBE9114777.1 protein kinase [Lusitaniella coriacea LEGE 07157]